jgi:hypothetical protein
MFWPRKGSLMSKSMSKKCTQTSTLIL